MFGFLRKDPKKQLEAKLAKLLEEARDLQRRGDMPGLARKSAEVKEVGRQLDALG
ncbi:MAG: DUF6435 family protein [Thermoanaerobaculia bacterium]|nr:DUF6435 family protein [Thermoanaerobaculia bacterium]